MVNLQVSVPILCLLNTKFVAMPIPNVTLTWNVHWRLTFKEDDFIKQIWQWFFNWKIWHHVWFFVFELRASLYTDSCSISLKLVKSMITRPLSHGCGIVSNSYRFVFWNFVFCFCFWKFGILMEDIADISRNICHQDDVQGYNASLLSCENPNF